MKVFMIYDAAEQSMHAGASNECSVAQQQVGKPSSRVSKTSKPPMCSEARLFQLVFNQECSLFPSEQDPHHSQRSAAREPVTPFPRSPPRALF